MSNTNIIMVHKYEEVYTNIFNVLQQATIHATN